jgi:hydroxyacylglutathione hydrolase
VPANLKLVIITHGDPDHAGNCARLQRKYGTKIAMHASDAAMVKTGAQVKRQARSIWGKLFLWLAERMGGRFDCFQPDLVLEDGPRLAEYGLAAKVLHTPGHTEGSMAVLTDVSRA